MYALAEKGPPIHKIRKNRMPNSSDEDSLCMKTPIKGLANAMLATAHSNAVITATLWDVRTESRIRFMFPEA